MNLESKSKIATDIAELVQQYKRYKQTEATYDSEMAMKAVFGDDIKEKEDFAEKMKLFDKAKKEVNTYKKATKELEQQIEDQISELILETCKEEAEDGALLSDSGTLDFQQLGSVNYNVETGYEIMMDKDMKAQLIEQLVDEGEFDLLDINEDALKEYSAGMYKTLGHHVAGVTTHPVVKTTIRVKK